MTLILPNPAAGIAEAFAAVYEPITTGTGQRIARPGFATATCVASSPNSSTDLAAQQISYDLRRLRMHGLIARIPGRHRYRLSDIRLHHDMLLTHIHTTGTDPAATAASLAAHSRPAWPWSPAPCSPRPCA
jgi:hypothetical protein